MLLIGTDCSDGNLTPSHAGVLTGTSSFFKATRPLSVGVGRIKITGLVMAGKLLGLHCIALPSTNHWTSQGEQRKT